MKVEIKNAIRYGKVLALGTKNVSTIGRRTEGTGSPSVNLGPPNISESTRARKLKLKSEIRYCEILDLDIIFFLLGASGWRTAP